MKVKSSIKKRKPGDILVRRGGIVYRINKNDPSRKRRQGKKKKRH
ncbi:50S ribosomal protein L36 [Patescibacteria group bacterium]